MDFLKSAVASAISKGPLAGYTVGDRVDIDQSIFTLQNGVKREASVKCSIFTFETATNRSRLPLAKNAVRKSRTLHHPGVVKVLDTIENDSHIYIITERLTPLSWYTKRSTLSEEILKWGLYQVAKTIKFINEEANSVHGCIRTSSIFVSHAGEWKVGAFDILSSMNDDDAIIYHYGSLVSDSGRFSPPEVTKAGWDTIKSQPLAAVDAYGYGTLVFELFNGAFSADQAAQVRSIPINLQQNYKRLVNPSPKIRLSVAHFLDQGRRSGGFFKTAVIAVSDGIDSLGLKSDGERAEFLRDLEAVSETLPEDYKRRRVLPELLKSVELGGGGPAVLTVVLQIGSKLPEDEYESQVTPAIIRLFSSPDRALRVCLLDNLPIMIEHLPQKIVNDKIFLNLVTGFTDSAPVVREQTVKAVLIIITKLSDRTVNGDLLKYLAKTANDEQPGIRTNTTICLGKIAKYLGPSTRTKVLVAAFTRSLRDPFVHARNAALMALGATSDMFSDDDCASKLLPALCPSLLDPEKMIRDQANKTVDQFLQRIRKHAQTLPDTKLPRTDGASNETSAAAAVPRMGTPARDSSWAGWAISSFTNKLSSADGQIQPKSNGVAMSSADVASRPANPYLNDMRTAPAAVEHPPVLPRRATETTKLVHSFTAPEVAEANGFWDDADAAGLEVDEAWGAMGDDEDDNDGATANSSTAGDAPSVSSGNTRSATTQDDGEPDFAGWLQAQKAAKAPSRTVLPKGLAPKAAATTAAGRTTATKPPSSKPTTTSSPVMRKPPTVSAKTPVAAKGKREAEDEGWGEAWE